jgi:2-phosphosulfolactate phosphatase
LQLNIFFNPAELTLVEAPARDIYIVIDAMRATTTLTVMCDAGAKQILIAQTIEQALSAAQIIPGRLLCGERHTQTPPGFDYGNSPALFANLDLTDKDLILTTSNGTHAFFACPEHSIRLAGCFYNAEAVTAYALRIAREQQRNISIVCAAEYGYFALEDAACAGYLALTMQQRSPKLQLHDNAHAAITLYEAYPFPRLVEYAQSARDLIAIGQQRDLEVCLQKDSSNSVPMVIEREQETGLLLLQRA